MLKNFEELPVQSKAPIILNQVRYNHVDQGMNVIKLLKLCQQLTENHNQNLQVKHNKKFY